MKKIFFSIVVLLILFSVNVSALEVSAKSAILINGTTGEILYSKNENTKLPMASTTKIMTALLLAEQNTPQKSVIVRDEMIKVEGSSMGLLHGDIVSYNDLLYGMLLASGNDAANVTAYTIAGSVSEFAKLMNAKAKKIGLLHTNFVTPSGLDDDFHYTTARDLAMLAKYAMQNKAFSKAAGAKSAILCYGNPPYKRSIRNHNKLLASYEGLIGVKTGFTKKSGRCLVTAAKRSNEYLLAVTLNAPNDWNDHRNMLDFGFSVLEEYKISCNNPIEDITVVGGSLSKVPLVYEDLNIGISQKEYDKISTEIILPKFIYAPVVKEQKIGEVIYFSNEKKIASTNIYSSCSVESDYNDNFINKIINTFVFLVKQYQE